MLGVVMNRFMGRLALLLGFITLLTGVAQLGARDSFQHVKTLEWVVFAWFVALAAISGYIEMHDFSIRYILLLFSILPYFSYLQGSSLKG